MYAFTELLLEESLLDPDLAQECGGNQRQSNQSAPLAQRDHAATEDSQQESGVDRMTHEAIRATAGQCVVLFQRYAAAPIAAQVAARGDGERQTRKEQSGADPEQDRGPRQEASTEDCAGEPW